MSKLSAFFCLVGAVVVSAGNTPPRDISRHLRPGVAEVTTMAWPSLNGTGDTNGTSLQESATISIGSRVFKIVDLSDNEISIGDDKFKLSS
ncbi:unnamed protein product [Phytophthora fragariaefolia]|uniref:Unnamed protein product n=1 Tax=Phytophthora fragariaefolia TaxID=1490495 RepID=A0A9W7D0C1_9STRA|nr:unnamed protein product [Phytophthora fragariaefolia]